LRSIISFIGQVCARVAAALGGALGGLDTLVFTAGIGENSNICARVMEKLAWLGFFILRPMLLGKR
jgi:acetate kinase